MNAFDAFYVMKTNPVEAEFLMLEQALDISVAHANRDYFLEMGLNSFGHNGLYMESPEVANAKTKNTFIKAVKAICNAIRNFISDIGDLITNIFGGDNVTPEEYLESPTGKMRLDKDIKQMDAIISDEIRKGNALLQKLSSATGISDEVIDNWIQTGTKRLDKLIPVIVPSAIGFGFRKILKSGLKSMKGEVNTAEKEAMKSLVQDLDTERKKMKILNHMNSLTKRFGEEAKKYGSQISKLKKQMKS